MDECQLAVNPKLCKFKVFDTEEDAESFVSSWEGAQLGSIVEGKGGKFVVTLPNVISEAITKAIDLAVDEVKLKVPLACEWVCARNWYQCH